MVLMLVLVGLALFAAACRYEVHIDDAECVSICEDSDDWLCYERCSSDDDDDDDNSNPDPDPVSGCTPQNPCGGDRDGDNIPNEREHACNTHPDYADSDGDGLPDGDEDADRDGATNADEIAAGSDPADPRSLPGRDEPDPSADTDGDGLTDEGESAHGCDPQLADTDGDGLSDGYEVASGFDPLDASTEPPACGAP